MAKTQTFNGFVKFVGTEAAYNTLKAQAAGKLIFAEITDITPAQSVTDMTGTGDSKIHEFRIFANGIEYNLTNRAAFNAAVAKLREAASINVEEFVGSGATELTESLISAGNLQTTLETLAQRIQDNYDAGIVTIEHIAPTTADTQLVYTFKQGGTSIGTVNIPRDQFLKKAEIVYGEYDPESGEFTPVNNPAHFSANTEEHSAEANAKTYLHFVFQVSDAQGYHDEDLYLDASSLIDVYTGLENQTGATSAKTADILVHVDADNKIWAEIKEDSEQIARLDARIDALSHAQDLSSLNAGIDVQKSGTGTTIELQHATSHVTGQSTSDVDYLEISAENDNEGIRIAEGAIQHDIVSGSASTKLVTEAAVWNTLAWDVYEPAASNEPSQQA